METIRNIRRMQDRAVKLRSEAKRIGLVPTMGFLHEGHLSLLDIARANSDLVVMSVFVNPTQFAPNEDLDAYPRDFDHDERLAQQRGCDIMFCPGVEDIYAQPYRTYISVEGISTRLCGVSRPHHFRGVTTIVAKLFNIVKPHIAVFGQKDAQQGFIIKQMVRDLNMEIEILIGPIVREPDGLAMSSRNAYLTQSERKDALVLNNALSQAKSRIESGERRAEVIRSHMEEMISSTPSARIDYVEIVDTTDFMPVEIIKEGNLIAVAAWIGKTRLIDNLIV